MNRRFYSLTSAAFALSLAVVGCKAESIETTYGTEIDKQADYSAGMGLVFESVKGDVTIKEGNSGEISANFKPFVQRGYTDDEEAAKDLNERLQIEMTADGSNVTINVTRLDGASDELGAIVEIYLPPEFDAGMNLHVKSAAEANPGNISVNYVANATSVVMKAAAGVSDCDLDGQPSIVSTSAECGGRIEITNVSDDVNATSDGLQAGDDFDIRVVIASISENATGGTITSEDGLVELEFPGDADYVLNASTGEGAIDHNEHDNCDVTDDSATSATVTCGDGTAVYAVEAGTDGVGDSNVKITLN